MARPEVCFAAEGAFLTIIAGFAQMPGLFGDGPATLAGKSLFSHITLLKKKFCKNRSKMTTNE
jgi:hypothetical protein